MKVKIVVFILVLLLLNLFAALRSFAQIPLVYDVENTGASCTAPPLPAVNQLVSYAMLPDPFAWSNGSGRITSFADWRCRRNEIKAEIEKYEIGTKPNKPATITASYSAANTTLTVNVTENGKTLTLTSKVVMPSGTGPFPVVIGMNAPTGQLPANLFNGVIQIPFNHDQVAKYTQGDRDPSYPFFQLYPTLTSNGYYSAWSWGISRLIDGIEIVQTQMKADTKRICVTGCSYAGKMALFAGAFDERVALTIAQESGGGGVNAWRVSETIGNVEKIDNTNYAWFMQSLKTNFQAPNVGKLPYDHHELMAMVAPRALLVLGNPDYTWLGDESGYVSCRAAQEVWKTFGVPERFGFSFRGGHSHCSLPSASNSEVTAFVDKFLRNSTTANTAIAVHPFTNTDYNKWITAWKGLVLTPPNNNEPTVTISAPLNNASYTEGETVTITATATPKTGTITKVDFYQGTQLLGSDATSPYSFTWTNVSAGQYQITAKATTSANDVGTSSAVNIIVTKAIFQTGSAPTIDGTIDAVWSNYTSVTISNVNTGTVSSVADLSGSWKAMWDATNLYVLVEVTDDVKRNDAGTDVYNDDGVEIYVDFGNTKAADYGANDHQYTFRWNDATAVYEINGHSVTGITKGIANTTTGYIVEVKIPWTTIGGTPTVNSLQGFEVMLNDDDDGAARDGKKAWIATTDDTWDNPSLMGTIVLKGLNCTPPAAAITTTTATTFCTGGSVLLTASAGTGYTYVWKKDNADISGATSATYSAEASGSYTVTITSGGCSATSTATTVTVNALPTAAITTTTPTTFCSGGSVLLTASAGSSYIWKNGTTQVGTGATYTATASGSYTVEVTNASNCKATSATITVTVNTLPTAAITAGGTTTFVQGGSVVLTASAGSSYIWKNGSSQVGTGASYTATSSGSYTVEVTNASGCKAVSAATVVTVNANQPSVITINSPSANTIITDTQIIFDVTAQDPDGTISKVDFYAGGVLVGTSATAPYIFEWNNPATGSHDLVIKVTDSNGGVTTSSTITVTVNTTTGIFPAGSKVFTGIAPNPSSESFKVTSNSKVKSLRILNMYGIEMGSITEIEAGLTTEIGTDLSDGAYLLLIEYASGAIEVGKLVKVK